MPARIAEYHYQLLLETRSGRKRRRSQLCFKQSSKEKAQLSYNSQDCRRIPTSLNKMYGERVECLDLSFNSIVSLEGLEGFPSLRDLILDNNRLTDLLHLPHMPNLAALSLNNNLITNLDGVLSKIADKLPSLTYLSLLGNPACPDQLSDREKDDADYQRYRYYVLHLLPNLKFLDSRRVSSSERSEAVRRGHFMKVRRPHPSALVVSPQKCLPPSYKALPVIPSRPQHKVDVIVDHSYTAAEEDELTLRPGDIIRGVERIPGGWWRGELRGRIGVFPDNFVRVVGATHDTNNDITIKNSAPRYCKAMFSYQQANFDELSLAVGDIIQVLGEEEEGWWRGQKGTVRGVFPSNFVVPLEPVIAPPPVLPPKPVREQCQVLYPYTAANADELSLAVGDMITIISKDVPDQGWWKGELKGRIGLFPDNFVTVLPTISSGSPGDLSKKPSRPAKNITSSPQAKSHPISSHRKDSTSSKSSIGSGQEPSSTPHKASDSPDSTTLENSKVKKPADSTTQPGDPVSSVKARRSTENDSSSETKARRSLEADSKPPVPSKKAGSPVAAMFSGLKQKFTSVEQKFAVGHATSNDSADGISSSKPSGEPVLVSVTGSQSNSQTPPVTDIPATESFDQVERTSMLNDPRAGRAKAPRRRPPSQALRDDVPLTNGNTSHSTENLTAEPEIIRPKTREWEKHKAPWMEELKLNQAKKTTPMAELGRSKTIATAETTSSEKSEVSDRLSNSTEKMLDSSAEISTDNSNNSLEMSQSMSALASKTIKIDTSEETKSHSENPVDMSKSMSSLSTRATHLETNNKVSNNELRTSISSSASVIMRSTTVPQNHPMPVQSDKVPTPVTRPLSSIANQSRHSTTIIGDHSVNKMKLEKNNTEHLNDHLNQNGSPEQVLIAQLNERIANLEKVVEAQEALFSSTFNNLNAKLAEEAKLRESLQAELETLKRCVTRV